MSDGREQAAMVGAATAQGRVLVLRVGGEYLAFPIEALRELLDAPALLPAPLAPPALVGQLTLRGQHLPVLDLGLLLGLARPAESAVGLALVAADGRYAIAADDALDIWEPEEFVRRPLPAGGDARGLLQAVLQRGGTIAGLVEPTALHGVVLATLRAIPSR